MDMVLQSKVRKRHFESSGRADLRAVFTSVIS